MNYYIFTAAIITALICLVHSVLGELWLIGPLLKSPLNIESHFNSPKEFQKESFIKGTIRLAWHITSILGLCLSLLLWQASVRGYETIHLYLIASTFFVGTLMSLFWTRGKHLSWLAFLASGILILLGMHL